MTENRFAASSASDTPEPGPRSYAGAEAGTPSAAPRGRRRPPVQLVLGLMLLLIGALWLLASLRIFDRISSNLALVLIFGSLAAFCVVGCRVDPARRWGLLVPAGFFAGLAFIQLVPSLVEPLAFFAGPAAGFAVIFVLEPRRKWALITAWICLVCGVTAVLDDVLRGALTGPTFFLCVAAVFIWHFLHSERDWAIIPAGLSVTLAFVTFVEWLRLPDRVTLMAFLFGLSASFAIYYLLGKPDKVRWAAIPSVAFAVLGIAALVFSKALVTFGVPLMMMGFGLYVIVRSQHDAKPVAPPPAPRRRDPPEDDPLADPLDDL